MNRTQRITRLLSAMDVLDEHNELKLLDSLTLIDLVARLERSLQLSIPLPLAFKTFQTKQAIFDLLDQLIQQQRPTAHV